MAATAPDITSCPYILWKGRQRARMFSPCASLVHRQENKSTSSARLPRQTSSHVSVTRIRPHAKSGPITLTRLTQMGYDPPLSLDALPLKQHQGPNSEAEGTDQWVASQPPPPSFRREVEAEKAEEATETVPGGGAEGWRACRVQRTEGSLTVQPTPCTVIIIFSFPRRRPPPRPRAVLVVRPEWAASMQAASALTGNCIRCSPFLPSRMYHARFAGPEGAGSTWGVSGILCFHLGPSFPVYLAVSLNPSPHTRGIFLV